MTPAEEAMRDAWLAEMWPVVHGTEKAREPNRRSTCKACGSPVDMSRKKGRPRQYCPRCRPALKPSPAEPEQPGELAS